MAQILLQVNVIIRRDSQLCQHEHKEVAVIKNRYKVFLTIVLLKSYLHFYVVSL